MAPNDITAGHGGNNFPSSVRKKPMSKPPKDQQGSVTKKHLNFRISSPLTPWGDETTSSESKKRRSSLKGKGAKNKDYYKKKEKRSSGNNNRSNKNLTSPKERSSFRYYPDIHEYIREYRHIRDRLTAGHKDCSCHGTYGPEEIEKAYESLGLPSKLVNYRLGLSKKDPWSSISSPAVQATTSQDAAADLGEINHDVNSESGEEREIASPEARKLRNNLNLSPLRKHVRLPDMKHYPVRDVSGLGVHDLVRYATAAGEQSRQNKKLAELNVDPPKLRYTSYDKQRLPCPPLHAMEKTMCRVVELSLEENKDKQKTTHDSDPEYSKSEGSSKRAKDRSKKRCESISDVVKDIDLPGDALAIAIETSRSNQSSVLSTAISPLSQSLHSLTPSKSQTIREMLSAAVTELQPFSQNVAEVSLPQSPQTLDCKPTAANLHARPVVSLKTFRHLGYKPSMRKFLHEIYSPTSEFGKQSPTCLISGKSIKTPHAITIETNDGSDSKREDKQDPYAMSQQSICANRILKRVRQRHIAMENYDALRREMALKRAAEAKPKLAIFSKCHTAVKSHVSVKGAAL
nr:uncharacterized protein LOC100185088 [Ciona intestinalis]|eukprot:XP_002127968.1 uncharacterized protein LOC100185088 [Ciona intestinalis]